MKNVIGATCVIVATTVSAAQAVEVTGGSVDLSYSAFLDETDIDKTSFEGSLEMAFDRNWAAQVDVGYDSFGFTGVDATSVGLHGIYHLNEETSFGAFYTHERAELYGLDDEADILGLEFGHESGRFEFEGYLGRGEAAGFDGTMFGLSGRYALSDRVGVTGAIDRIEVEGVDLQSLSLKVDGEVSDSLNLYVELGSGKADLLGASESEPFVGVGGKVTFGAKRGATFERRSIADLLPGL